MRGNSHGGFGRGALEKGRAGTSPASYLTGRKKRGVAFNYQGQRCGRPHVATWAETATVLAADLMAGNEDP
ncbi:MAG: hypothetical protein M3Q75_01855, partial [Gemmatimonadota bacterium]|nr:hypothetical protein [Gemmatimonadota bacterium]